MAASAAMQYPFLNLARLQDSLHVGDGRTQAWVLAWVAHALSTGVSLFDANMFYPTTASLAHTDSMIFLGAISVPAWLLTGNAILGFNLLQLLGPAVTSLAAFVLLRNWTGDGWSALVGGLTFGLSFFALLHNAHLNLTWAAGLPLSILLMERWWRSATWGRLAALWLVFVCTALTSWYLGAMLGVLLVIHACVMALAIRRVDIATRVPQIIAGGALAVAVLLPFVAPYLGRGSEAGEAAALAADVRSYLVPPENTLLGKWLVSRTLVRAQSIWGESTLFLGWIALALAVIGLVVSLRSQSRERRTQTYLVVALLIVGLLLSFGPSSSGFAPYDLVAHAPGIRAFRATARFALLVCFACSVLVTFGLVHIRRRLSGRLAVLVMLVLSLLLAAERFVIDFPSGRPQSERIPEVYALARADDARAAIVLPIYAGLASWFFEGDYLLYSTTAGFLPLANGIGRWVPPEYLALGEAMRDFPSPSSANALRLYGITHVILHSARYGGASAAVLAKVRRSADFTMVAERGPDVLLRVAHDDGITDKRSSSGSR